MPAITAVACWVVGRPPDIEVPAVLALGAAFLVAAACEEAGWTGYLLAPWRRRFGVLGSGLAIGCVWALWHAVPWVALHGVVWTAWQCLFTVAARVIMVWLCEQTNGSVLAATLFHAMINICYAVSPDYRPDVVGPLTAVVAAVSVGVRPRRPPR